MTAKDRESLTKALVALDSQTVASNTTTVGNEIDTQFFESATFVNTLGVWTDGDFAPLLEETDTSGSGYTAVADADLLPDGTGQEAAASLGASNAVAKIGYRGGKRFVRMSIVSTGVSTGSAGVHSIVELSHPAHAPVA